MGVLERGRASNERLLRQDGSVAKITAIIDSGTGKRITPTPSPTFALASADFYEQRGREQSASNDTWASINMTAQQTDANGNFIGTDVDIWVMDQIELDGEIYVINAVKGERAGGKWVFFRPECTMRGPRVPT